MNTYTIQLTEQELATVGKALGYMPYGEVAMLVANINKQIERKPDADATGKESTAVD